MARSGVNCSPIDYYSKFGKIQIDSSTKSIYNSKYEPFVLCRFATDHSLKKVASRPLLISIRNYATELTASSRPLIVLCKVFQLIVTLVVN